MTDDTVARDAKTAWEQLKDIGGIELEGRDEEMEAALLDALDVDAGTLNEALGLVSTDQLVSALFAVALPYVEMFSAILDFFRRADARFGRHHWTVKLEDRHVGLDQFEEVRRTWQDVRIDVEAAAIDGDGARTMADTLREALRPEAVDEENEALASGDHAKGRPGIKRKAADRAVKDWLECYARERRYERLPQSLHPDALPNELREFASVVWVIGDTISRNWRDHEALMMELERRIARPDGTKAFERDPLDGYAIGSIVQIETDFWLRDAVQLLSRAQTGSPEDLRRIETGLAKATAPFGRKSFGVRGSWDLLERILALPVWKERHALYAVWIGTEIIAACDGHDVRLNHQNGVIEFAFKKTLVATIESAEPLRYLYSERRVDLDHPVGDPELKGAQPDYSLWRGKEPSERCDLVIEVKHYKRSARRRFANVMTNYARAHPQALVALASHGPTGDPTIGRDAETADRFRALPLLRTQNFAARRALKALVREAVGEPLLSEDAPARQLALMIDVSGSMERIIKSPEFATWYKRQLDRGLAAVVAVDEEIVYQGDGTTAVETIAGCTPGRGTSLSAPARDIVDRYGTVIVATDGDGYEELKHLSCRVDGTRVDQGLLVVTLHPVPGDPQASGYS